jgi:hypothetical protein
MSALGQTGHIADIVNSTRQFCCDAHRCLLVGFVLVGSPNVLRTIVWLAQIRQSSTRMTKATLEASFMAANWVLEHKSRQDSASRQPAFFA